MVLGVRLVCPASAVCISSVLPTRGTLKYVGINTGYAQLHGEFNYNATPLAPPSTQVIIHENTTVRGTWASHGVKGWYLGPSMNHY